MNVKERDKFSNSAVRIGHKCRVEDADMLYQCRYTRASPLCDQRASLLRCDPFDRAIYVASCSLFLAAYFFSFVMIIIEGVLQELHRLRILPALRSAESIPATERCQGMLEQSTKQ